VHIADLSRLTDRVVGRVLSEQADIAGDATWLMSDERKVKFGQARQLVSRIAGTLSGFGLSRCDAGTKHLDASITGPGRYRCLRGSARFHASEHRLPRRLPGPEHRGSDGRGLVADAYLAQR
jgi:hypothetical protein